MIKCEVVFDGDIIKINGYEIHNVNDDYYDVFGLNDEYLADFRLEQAIAYCLENK